MKTLAQPARKSPLATAAAASPIIREISALVDTIATGMRTTLAGCLHVGLRLLYLRRQSGDTDGTGSLKAALERIADRVPLSTAYRWLNAASAILCDDMGLAQGDDIHLPEPGSREWAALEKLLTEKCQGMSLRRILIGSVAASDDARQDTLITYAEAGDKAAEEILEKVAAGELTLVQAIRAQAGAAATRGKERHDPIYLDIDGRTGQPTGLFPKCLVTLANTFRQWESLDEAARQAAKKSWKELVTHLPRELR